MTDNALCTLKIVTPSSPDCVVLKDFFCNFLWSFSSTIINNNLIYKPQTSKRNPKNPKKNRLDRSCSKCFILSVWRYCYVWPWAWRQSIWRCGNLTYAALPTGAATTENISRSFDVLPPNTSSALFTKPAMYTNRRFSVLFSWKMAER